VKKLGLYIIMLFLLSCGEKRINDDPNDPLLAAVYDQNLYLSDIKPLLQTESSPEDSIQYTHALIEKWVREAILMREAERNIPDDLDIQKMVNDYRSSLILLSYKQELVEEELDTSVTADQMKVYYDEHKSQYKLDEPILQCILYKVDKKHGRYEEINDLWKDKKYEELALLSEEIFEIKLSDIQWYTWKDIKSLVPRGFWSYGDVKSKDPRSKSSGNYKYYLKVTSYEDKNKIAPLSYIEDQITKIVLHKRQTALLDDLKQELYEKYVSNSNVKINI